MLACVLAGADEARVLRVGLEEVVHLVLAEGVEVVVRLRRFERRLDGGETGVRDGRGRQALVHREVVGRVVIEVAARERAGVVVTKAVNERGVDL